MYGFHVVDAAHKTQFDHLDGHVFENGPGVLGTLFEAIISAEITAGVELDFKHAYDQQALTTTVVAGVAGTGERDYVVSLLAGGTLQGDRLRVQFTVDEAAALFAIHGITLRAFDTERPPY